MLLPIVEHWGFPSVFALILAVGLILIPTELGYLLYQGKRQTGRMTLIGVVSYIRSISRRDIIIWTVMIFIATGMIFTLLKPAESWLQERMFSWMPAINSGLDGHYSKNILIVTYFFFFVLVSVLGPLTEELYFRGYLLPRIKGSLAPVIHSVLFALYHVFSPWMIITRIFGLLPLIYAVRKKNLLVGIFVHVLLNSLDAVAGLVFIYYSAII